jgi:hypothetical protein
MLYQTRNNQVEAVQWDGMNIREVQELIYPASPLLKALSTNMGIYDATGGLVFINVQDYLVKIGDRITVRPNRRGSAASREIWLAC